MTNQADWISKEKRELFCKCVNCFIMKAGADKDPIMEKVLPIAKEVVNTAFIHYPDLYGNTNERPTEEPKYKPTN